MTQMHSMLEKFIAEVKTTQKFFGLQDPKSEDWVVIDSSQFENTDAMPVWSSAELAQQHCCDEWQDYQAAEITLAEWLEFWIEDLSEDNVIIGVNWQDEGECVEVELADFSQALATVETL